MMISLPQPMTIDYVHRRQGMTGHFARVRIKFSPAPLGSGFTYTCSAKTGGDHVPEEWLSKVEQGLRNVIGNESLQAELLDTAFHMTDSNADAFELAAIGCAEELVSRGKAQPL
jgi:elongation factor G